MDLSFPQAEEAVIGAILIDAEHVLPAVTATLRPEDFSDPTLRHLFEAARDLFLAQKPVDPVTIGAASGAGEEYGRIASAIMARTPTASNAAEYAELVRRSAQLRALQAAGWELAQCRDLEEARALIGRMAAESADARSRESRSWRELAQAFMASLDGAPDEYLDLGIPELTKAARLQQGQYLVLGAYNSVGKTALALQMAYALAASGKRVGFFSLETADMLLARRVFAQQTETRMRAIQDHELSREEIRRAGDLVDRSWDFELRFFPAAGFSPADIRAHTVAHRLDVIFIDYVQLVAGAGESVALQLRAVSIALHTLAQQLGVAVIALSQVTPQRDGKGKRLPLRKENLRESQQLANDADVVLLLDLTDDDNYSAPRVLCMDKNKDVGQARMLLAFDGPRVRFSYLPPPNESAEVIEARERNQEKKRAKAEKEKAARDAQESAFTVLEGGAGGDLPF